MENFDDHTGKFFDKKTAQFLSGGAARNRILEEEGGLKKIEERAHLEGYKLGYKDGHEDGKEEGYLKATKFFVKEMERNNQMLLQQIENLLSQKTDKS